MILDENSVYTHKIKETIMAVLSDRNFSLWMAKMKRKIQVADISSLLKRKTYVRPLRKMRSLFYQTIRKSLFLGHYKYGITKGKSLESNTDTLESAFFFSTC